MLFLNLKLLLAFTIVLSIVCMFGGLGIGFLFDSTKTGGKVGAITGAIGAPLIALLIRWQFKKLRLRKKAKERQDLNV